MRVQRDPEGRGGPRDAGLLRRRRGVRLGGEASDGASGGGTGLGGLDGGLPRVAVGLCRRLLLCGCLRQTLARLGDPRCDLVGGETVVWCFLFFFMEGEGLSEFLCSFEALSMMLPVLFFQLYSPFVLQLVLELCKLDLNLAQAIMREDLGVGPLRARRRRGLLAIVAAVVGAAARPVPDCEFIRLDVARGAGAAGCLEANAVVHFFGGAEEGGGGGGGREIARKRVWLSRRFGK